MEMEGIKIDNVLFPKELIFRQGKLEGYTMDFFANSMPLSYRFMVRYVDCEKLFDYVGKASQILRDIHKNEIICQDFSFENVFVDNDGRVVIGDIDACCYKQYDSPFISLLMKRFWIDYRNNNIFFSQDFDRISMMLSFFNLIYDREIQSVSKRQYNKLSRNIRTLENMKEYANILVNKNSKIETIPYLDELIDFSDNFVYDRNKLLGISRLLKK